MSWWRHLVVACLASTLVVVAGCGGDAPSGGAASRAVDGSARPSVYVVNYPLQYFAERIGGAAIRVECPVPAGIDPAFWHPTAAQVAAFQQADLILLNGAGYAKWLTSVSLPSARLVDTAAGFQDRLIHVEDAETHAHGPAGEHEHGGVAFTTWLDLRLAVEHARATEAALRQAFPDHQASFREGLDALEAELVELDREIRETVAQRSVPLLGSHPVYQYLARGYGLEIESVHFEPDEYPDAAAWSELQAVLDRHPARWMLWEGRPLERTATQLKSLGVESVVYDPCGSRPESGDFLSVQQTNLAALRRIL